MQSAKLLVDVHTHVYLPSYVSMLRARSSIPKIIESVREDGRAEERLLILEHEPSGGRPVGKQYWDRDQKLAFMDKLRISSSPAK